MTLVAGGGAAEKKEFSIFSRKKDILPAAVG
jgi:hypothetical protein